jgi:hypothetical protein
LIAIFEPLSKLAVVMDAVVDIDLLVATISELYDVADLAHVGQNRVRRKVAVALGLEKSGLDHLKYEVMGAICLLQESGMVFCFAVLVG